MISVQDLARTFLCRVVCIAEDASASMYRIEFQGNYGKRFPFDLVIPKINNDGRITRLFKPPRYSTWFVDIEGNMMDAKTKLLNVIKERAVSFISMFKSTGKPSPYILQSAIDNFVDQLPGTEANIHADYVSHHRVSFDIPLLPGPFERLDFLSQLLKDWWGIVDLIDTPATTKIGSVGFKCVEGSILGPSLSKVPFVRLLHPKRLTIMGRIFRNAMPIKAQEEPFVKVSPDIPEAPSVNALCAFMVLPDNYEDAVVVSESFAEKLYGTREVSFTLIEPKQILVLVGDKVEDGIPIGRVETGTETAKMNRLESGIVGEIITEEKIVAGVIKQASRVVITLQHPFLTGDKISTRAAMKGVATVVPDSEMPIYLDSPVDIVFNPICMARRECLSQIAEGWLGLKCVNEDIQMVVDPWDTRDIRSIADEMGIDKDGRDVVKYKGYIYRVFIGMLSIMRLNKIVTGMDSWCADEVLTDLHGFEDGSSGAVKISAPELIAMSAVGADSLVKEVLSHRRGVDAFYHLLKASLGQEGRIQMITPRFGNMEIDI